jgi:hypothetical protein
MANAGYPRYSEADSRSVDDLTAQINDFLDFAKQAVSSFERRESFHEKVSLLKPKWMRVTLSHPGPNKLDWLFLQDLVDAQDWVSYLHACVQQDGPRESFDATLVFAKQKLRAGQAKLTVSCRIMEAFEELDIDMDAESLQRNIRSLELQLEQAVDGNLPGDPNFVSHNSLTSSPSDNMLLDLEIMDVDMDAQDTLFTIPGPAIRVQPEISSPGSVSCFSFSFSKFFTAHRVRNPRGLTVKIFPLVL